MIPVLPLILLLRLIFSIRAEVTERRVAKDQGRPYTRSSGPLVSPGFGRTVWFIVAWFFLPSALVLLIGLPVQGEWRFVPLLVPCVALLMPWWFTRFLLVPLHQARLALLVLRAPSVAWGKDRRGGAYLAAAWALLSARKPSDETVRRIAAGLEKQKPLRAAGMAASGLLAAFRGDLDRARRILESVEQFHFRARPDAAVRLAREWLAVDAVERGDWQACARHWGQLQQNELGVWLFQRATGPRSRLTRLIGKVGSRVMRDPRAPGTVSVWLSWALAPRRLISLPWVRRALAEAGARGGSRKAATMRPASANTLDQALSAHALVVGRGAGVRPAELTRALKAWERAFEDPEVMGRIQKRALSLEVSSPERVLFEMRKDVLEDLALASARARMQLRLLPSNGLGMEIGDRLRGDLLESVEKATEALHRRLQARHRLPASEELAESLSVQEACARAAAMGGDELRRIAFAISQPDVCDHAVWLFNVQEEKPIANAIMQWLLSEARAVGDAQGVELHGKNVGIGI